MTPKEKAKKLINKFESNNIICNKKDKCVIIEGTSSCQEGKCFNCNKFVNNSGNCEGCTVFKINYGN